MVAPGRFQLERGGRPADPGARWHGHLHRPDPVRLVRQRDLEPGGQPEHLSGCGPGADQEGFDPAAVVRPERDGPRLQVAPDLDHRPGGGPAAAVGHARHARGDLLQGRQRDLHAERRPGGPGRHRPGTGRPSVLRRGGQQRAQPGRRRHLRDRQRGRGPLAQHLDPAAEDLGLRLQRRARVQLHRREEQPAVHRNRERPLDLPAGAG